ncbi:hypothetical protein QZH41_019589 [Actinostola sp. cb2023]|nr:hypothetical protein QZH41_019589 [Actinostola sp. cb2023]
MTTKMCRHLTAFVLLILALGLSTKISDEVRRGKFLGVTMYFNMSRHSFGELQSKLFPKYFLAGICLSVVSLASYCLMHPMDIWEGRHQIQVVGLTVSLLCNMVNYMWLEPSTTRLMVQRYAFEKERGYGDEIGPIPDNKLKTNEDYLKITKSFACIHGFSSMLNLASYAGCLLHLWYLASFVEML